jgi:monoterpene epsilon-lactone hydrolase
MTQFRGLMAMSIAALLCGGAVAQQVPLPNVDDEGTITGQQVVVPLSNFLSEEIKAEFASRLRETSPISLADGLDAVRARSDEGAKGQLDRWLEIYPSSIQDTEINGVHVHIVVPDSGIADGNDNRVLINAHQGGFMFGGAYGGQLESVPLAGLAGVKVIAVDYRLAPEHTFPAASEDMEAVYRHVLETTPPANVGIYGCSAGGTLTAQVIPWFREKGLPLPGAIGIFCSGAMNTFWFGGDAGVLSPLLNASRPVNRGNMENQPRNYFEGVDQDDPLVTPGEFPEALAAYPPTLVVSGTRDIAMSNAVMTHTRLLEAGVEADLFIQEGLGHGHFFMFPGTPEAETAHRVIWNFFDRHLGR